MPPVLYCNDPGRASALSLFLHPLRDVIMSINTSTLDLPSALPPIRINHKPLWAALLLVLAGAAYLLQSVGWRQSALWVVGALLGVTLYHASFGFTQAWRVFVSDRRGAGLRAQMVMLAVGVLLFFPFLAQGTLWGQPVSGFVSPPGVSVVLGVFLFGIGMQLGGGCASGTLFAVGGGNTRMLVTLLFFIVGSVIATANFGWWSALPALPPTSLIKSWGLPGALLANLAVFALIAWTTTVLEKRRHGQLISHAARTSRTPSLLQGPWPMVWGGIALVVLNFATLALAGRPWGITSAFALWGAKALDALGGDVASGAYWSRQQAALAAPVRQDITSVMDIGLMLGALAAASAAGKFAPVWKVPARSLLAAVVGGLLLGYGARLAFGCNIGAYFSGILSGSLHAWLWLPAAFLGSALGVRLRPWFGLAVEKTPAASSC
ncbi:YeeE/YedE family protein [Bordetella parapertussis]|uniref:YeeE/YedE family protein n=1 Tax=Bordetella parapertussis TaxID=519 RepID=UPI0019336788|nr:YeeE/YedE family protein [Bordetella parapertussis]MEB2668284.1 YeeE/YedE family protein [Bordetella parapertussis]QRE67182.1 YeeE/YedE family protein [Bordetella parapertussis]